MKIAYFTHSLVSCWNHGNAHFLRGLLRELIARGHDVDAFEPEAGWSRTNLVEQHGERAANRFFERFPELDIVSTYGLNADPAAMVDGADLVVVHEWTDPSLVAALGRLKVRGTANVVLLFHDTHHRGVSDPDAIRRLDLASYDGVLAFGQSLADVYRRAGWGGRAFVFHEAADTKLFAPPADGDEERRGAVWIGNWGDEERTDELATYLLRPTRDERIALDVYGVRYPIIARETLCTHGAMYRGWLPNDKVPRVFANHHFTVHVPRRYYARLLPGIPTIRVFEALACGLPLVCAPWDDTEGLFRGGEDFLVASNEREMRYAMRALTHDRDLRRAIAESGLRVIRERHSCAHRADELLAIASRLNVRYRGAA